MKKRPWVHLMFLVCCVTVACNKDDNISGSQTDLDELVGAWDNTGVQPGLDYIFIFSSGEFRWFISDGNGTSTTITGKITASKDRGYVQFEGKYVQDILPLNGPSQHNEGNFNDAYPYLLTGDQLQIALGQQTPTVYKRRTV